MVQRSLSFLLAAGLVSCSGDPTGDLANGPDHLIATPSAIFVENGVVSTVLVTAVDEAGNQVADNFTLSAADVGPNIEVSEDTTYNLVRNDKGEFVRDPHPTRIRYNVKTDVYVASEFTVRAGSRSVTIPVRTEPATLVSTVSDLTPAAGDTITINAPAGLSFSPTTSTVTFGTLVTQLVSRTATAIRFVAPPAAGGPATVSNVSLDYAPGAGLFAVPTAGSFAVPALPLIAATPSGARTIGDTITIVLPAPYKFVATSTATVGAAPKSANIISADSTTLKFQIGPNANDTVRVAGVVMSGAPALGTFLMKAGTVVSTPVVTNFAATLSNAAPALNEELTITANGTFRFLPTSSFTIGGEGALVTFRSADSSSVRVVPVPTAAAAAAGPVTATGVVFATLRSVSLTLPTVATVTRPVAPTALNGADAFATAPTMSFPAVGATAVFVDAGAFAVGPSQCTGTLGAGSCRILKFTVTAQTTAAFSVNWSNTADLGLYFFTSAPALRAPTACDSFGSGAGGQPEVCTGSFAPGTYYAVIASYSAAVPFWTRIRIIGS